jgi:hypothetical protein
MTENVEDENLEIEAGPVHLVLGAKSVAAIAGAVSLAISGLFGSVDMSDTFKVSARVASLERDIVALRELCKEFNKSGNIQSCKFEEDNQK